LKREVCILKKRRERGRRVGRGRGEKVEKKKEYNTALPSYVYEGRKNIKKNSSVT
jgi:hypothetical protein